MLAGNMNNGEVIDLISDSDDDTNVEYPIGGVQLPASANTRFGQNGGHPLRFQDEDWQKNTPASSSSRPAENSNGQYRTLPPSFTNGRHTERGESARYTFGSGDRTHPHSSSYMGTSHDSARGLSASKRVNTVGENHADDNNKRVLPPSFSNGNTENSMHPNVASETRKLPPHFTSRKSQILGDNRMGANISNGSLQPFSSQVASQNSQKEDVDDDVIVYGGPSSRRVLPSSFGASSSRNSEVVNGFDAQGRLNPENRILDSDERAVYQEALQNISRQKGEDDLPEGVLTVPLLKHQKMALAWMVSKENSSHCAGGILADDQGLGKTVSTIALIQKQRIEQSKFMSVDSDRLKSEALNLDEDDEGAQTVNNEPKKDQEASSSSAAASASGIEPCGSQPDNVPDKTVESRAERKKKARACTSSASTSRSMTRPAAGTLVVCPASVLKQWANELNDKVSESAKLSVLVYHGGTRTKDPSELAKYDVVITTYTIVANEVPKQNADDDDQKNSQDTSAGNKRKPPSNAHGKNKKKKKKLKDYEIDLESGPIARVRWFRVVLDEAQTIKNFRTQVAKACCGLRAKRRWCLSGTPIQNAIDELYSYFRFLKYDPYSTYSSFCTMIKHPIARNAITGYKKLQTVLRIVLLRRTKETLINGEPIIKLPPKTINLNKVDFSQEERSFYLTLEERSRQQFKAFAAAGTLKQNYANILLMLLRLRQACDHPLLVKGNQSEYGGDGSIEMAKQLPKEVIIDLLAKLEVGSALCTLCSDPPEDAVVTICGHVFCYPCIHERITSDENMCPSPNCSKTLSLESLFSSGALRICISGKSSSARASSSADDESSAISQSSFISSKIQAAIDILNSIINTDALTDSDIIESNQSRVPAKAIVFSQWTGMLDLLELSLNSNLIQYRRLDGTMSLNLRDKAVKDFNTDPEVRVMIMSLKAGNLGLNMVAACHVILLDLWWNPYAEDQAVDRAHRIGQTRPVTVSRLTVKDTVEDRILALQEEKRTMVNSAFGEDKSGGHATRLTVEDLRYLFRI
ncbi:hypothetical protein ACP70R_003439 [Stipagrostis hirtigluma subsp. patula]